jgi:methylated-DNA-[protein]-cysteine S-methyltransferase
MSLSSFTHASSPSPDSSLKHALWKSPIGTLGLVRRRGGLTRIHIGAEPDTFPFQVERTYGEAGEEAKEDFGAVRQQLEEYFAGRRLVFRLPLDLDQGTPFQRRVWKALRDIPYGETVSYKEIAHTIGQPSATRAVGSAVGHNPLPVILPCHRVISRDGSLGGFSAGLDVKRRLLELERVTRERAVQLGMLSPGVRHPKRR